MYSDQEIDCLYLGKPLQEGSRHLYGDFVDLITFCDEEAKELFLKLPMISRLINIPWRIGEGEDGNLALA